GRERRRGAERRGRGLVLGDGGGGLERRRHRRQRRGLPRLLGRRGLRGVFLLGRARGVRGAAPGGAGVRGGAARVQRAGRGLRDGLAELAGQRGAAPDDGGRRVVLVLVVPVLVVERGDDDLAAHGALPDVVEEDLE